MYIYYTIYSVVGEREVSLSDIQPLYVYTM